MKTGKDRNQLIEPKVAIRIFVKPHVKEELIRLGKKREWALSKYAGKVLDVWVTNIKKREKKYVGKK